MDNKPSILGSGTVYVCVGSRGGHLSLRHGHFWMVHIYSTEREAIENTKTDVDTHTNTKTEPDIQRQKTKTEINVLLRCVRMLRCVVLCRVCVVLCYKRVAPLVEETKLVSTIYYKKR